MTFGSMEELKRHLAETGSETEIIIGDDSEPKTEARKQFEKEDREARQRALYGFLLPEIERAGLPPPVREFVFWPNRKWPFDLAWPDHMVALEIEGGTWMTTGQYGKGHGHPIRFASDCEKYSHAAIAGWRVIRATVDQVESGEAVIWLTMAFEVLAKIGPSVLPSAVDAIDFVAHHSTESRSLEFRWSDAPIITKTSTSDRE